MLHIWESSTMKNSIRALAVGFGVLVASTGIALANGSYKDAVPAHDWSGFYAGAHVGYGWGDKVYTTGSGNLRDFDVSGVLGGIQAGYNTQMNSILLGVEGDVSYTGIDGGTAWTSGGNNAGPRDINVDVNWIATIAARVGLAIDNTLIFAKAGLAIADEDYSHLSANGVRTGGATRTGLLLGVGAEHAFSKTWSLKAEFNYMDFGTDSAVLRVAGAPDVSRSIEQELYLIKFGVNYHF
jgi:outer membrane immunogenic protein